MATKTTKGSLGGGKVKFRVIEFELEGSDESLHDGLKNLAAALLRTNSLPVSRQIGNSARATNGAEPPTQEVEDDPEEAELVESDSPESAVKRSPRKPAVVRVLEEIDFNNVSPTLTEFFASKKPGNVLDNYLVIAYWYKNYRKISDLSVDHFHTALRYLNKPTPKDAMQPVRDLRHRKRGKFSSGKTPGTATINHVGENSVRELGGAA